MVKNLVGRGIRNTTDILFRRQASITTAAAVIIILTLASRLLGLVRYRVLAGQFGSESLDLTSFLAAFTIPDFIFNVIVIGALSTAFIPVISGYLAKREVKEAQAIFSVVISYALLLTAAFTVVVFIFSYPIAQLLLPGLRDDLPTMQLTSELIRILTFAQFFLIASNFVTGMLNSYHRFLVPALAPVIYNIGIILGTIFLAPSLGIFGPAAGVIIGALGHLLIQLPVLKKIGVNFQFNFDRTIRGVREIARLTGPRALAMAIAPIDSVVDVALASLITSAPVALSVNTFKYAFVLQALPAGVFGYALGMASLPTLSKEFAQENLENFKATLISSLHQIMYLVIPTVAILVVLRIPVVRLVYGVQGFSWESTKLVAFTLAAFAVGILAQSAIQLLGRGFYALHDTKTPVKITIVTVVLNVVLSFALVSIFNSVVALAVATSIAGSVSALALLFYLSKRVGGFDWNRLLVPIFKMIFAATIAAVALYTPLKILDSASYGQLWLQGSIINTVFGPLALDTSKTVGLIVVTTISGILGLLVYILLTYILGVEEIRLFRNMFRRVRQTRVIKTVEEAVSSEPVENTA